MITEIVVGLLVWLVVSVVLGCIVGQHLRGEEKPVEMGMRSPQGWQRGILWVDGEATVRYEMAPPRDWPRYFCN